MKSAQMWDKAGGGARIIPLLIRCCQIRPYLAHPGVTLEQGEMVNDLYAHPKAGEHVGKHIQFQIMIIYFN